MQRAVSPSPFGINYGIEYLFMAVVGGAGYVWGALLGSTVILVLKDQLQNWLPKLLDTNANFEMIVFGVLILMLQYAQRPVADPANWWDGLTGADGSRQPAPPAPPALPARQRPKSGQVVLEVDAIRKEFGGLVAVNDISFKVSSGEIMGLIGPNGAGKHHLQPDQRRAAGHARPGPLHG